MAEREYDELEEVQCWMEVLDAFGREASRPTAEVLCQDMVKVLMAWRRGNLLPRREVPRLVGALCAYFDALDGGRPRPPSPKAA
jgi:hypothetical protein